MLLAMQAHAVGASFSSQTLRGLNGGASGSTVPKVGSLAEQQVNVAGITSIGERGGASNLVLTFNIGAGTSVTGIGWDLNVTAFTPGWLSELAIGFGDSALTAGVDLNVGAGDDLAGVGMAYSSGGVIDLIGLNLNFAVGADGILRLEFFESFDDAAVDPDGIWNSGFLTLQTVAVVPEPSSYGLMALGLLAVGTAARRRRRD